MEELKISFKELLSLIATLLVVLIYVTLFLTCTAQTAKCFGTPAGLRFPAKEASLYALIVNVIVALIVTIFNQRKILNMSSYFPQIFPVDLSGNIYVGFISSS